MNKRRLDALRRVWADLPPTTERAWLWPKPTIHENGTVEFTKPHYFKSLTQTFDVFRDGEFGFAIGDKKYLSCLEAWSKRTGVDPFNPANSELLDREACLLILRFFDRQERFVDGAWTEAHASGILHVVIQRLLDLDAAGI